MSTKVDFKPSTGAPFTFQPTLGGTIYTVIITWSLYGQRYYFNLYTLDGTRVITRAMVGSPPDYDINLLPITLSASLVYRAASAQFEYSD